METNKKGKTEKIKEEVMNLSKRLTDQLEEKGLELVLVEPNGEFEYPYLLVYPKEGMKDRIVLDCLNDYEKAFENGKGENLNVQEMFYRSIGDKNPNLEDINLEDNLMYEDVNSSFERFKERYGRAIEQIMGKNGKNEFGQIYHFPGAPIMLPIIPGLIDEKNEDCKSEMNSGVAKEMAVQMEAMIKNAKEVLESRTKMKISDKIIAFGHSKESTFADHLSVMCSDQIKTIILGGGEFATLPLQEIKLKVVKEKQDMGEIGLDENGVPYMVVTEEELKEITNEYNSTKKENQKDIATMEDGSVMLPLNFPMGMADIENYITMPNGMTKEEYIEDFKKTPRFMFAGENEEQKEGHYAYNDCIDKKGEKVKHGQDFTEIDSNIEELKWRRDQVEKSDMPEDEKNDKIAEYNKKINQLSNPEVERASMHNRVVNNVETHRILFGKSADERLRRYLELTNLIGMKIESKIYKAVGHVGIYDNRDVGKDLGIIYNNSIDNKENIAEGVLNDGASRISPAWQLIRRYCVSNTTEEEKSKENKFDQFMEQNRGKDRFEEQGLTIDKILSIINKNFGIDENTPREVANAIYDNLTQEELANILDEIFIKSTIAKEQKSKLTLQKIGNGCKGVAEKSLKNPEFIYRKGMKEIG